MSYEPTTQELEQADALFNQQDEDADFNECPRHGKHGGEDCPVCEYQISLIEWER